MTKITLEPEFAQRLRQTPQRAELCDGAGRVVGFFHPAVDAELYRVTPVPFTAADLDRFEAEPGERSLDEIMRELRAKT